MGDRPPGWPSDARGCPSRWTRERERWTREREKPHELRQEALARKLPQPNATAG
jgi:hypothetical protein